MNYANDRALLANKAAARRKSAGLTATTKKANTSAIIHVPVIKFVEERSPVLLQFSPEKSSQSKASKRYSNVLKNTIVQRWLSQVAWNETELLLK